MFKTKERLHDFEYDEGFLAKADLDSGEWRREAARYRATLVSADARKKSHRALDINITLLALVIFGVVMISFLFRYWGNPIHAIREAPAYNRGEPAPPPPLPEYLDK